MHLAVANQRSCGTCAVCCVAVQIKELDKPAREPCHNLEPCGYGCTKHVSGDRPAVCHKFQCAWLRGHGDAADRPNDVGVMVTVNTIEGQHFVMAMEFLPGAVLGAGARIVAAMATETKLPVIVSDYEALPPADKGDRVAVHTSILYRSRRLVGPLIAWLAPDVALHVLVKEAQ